MELPLWIIIALLATVPAWIFRKAFKIEIQGPFCLWRTKKGNGLVKKLAKYKFFTWLADIGLIFAFGLFGALYLYMSKEYSKKFRVIARDYIIFIISAVILIEPTFIFQKTIVNPIWLITLLLTGFGGLALYIVIWATHAIIIDLMAGRTPVPIMQPVIPGLEIPGAPIQVPLSAWVSLLIVIIVHEFSHGITTIREKIKLKSMGLVTAGIFPIGAFAEPDEKQLKKASMKKRLRVYSSGSMMNFAFTFIFLALMIPSQIMIQPVLFSNYYTEILTIEAGSPAEIAGLETGMKVYNLEALTHERTPNTMLTLVTDKGNYTALRNEEGMIGITFDTNLKLISDSFSHWALFYFLEIVTWTALLNFAVGMFNFIPFAIFDGSRMFEDLVNFYSRKLGFKKKNGKKWVKIFSAVIGLMLIINIAILFIQ